mgnify:CR=1 FL=1
MGLTPQQLNFRNARDELRGELRRLYKRLTDLQQACAALPRAQEQGEAMLLSIREYEPRAFTALRR